MMMTAPTDEFALRGRMRLQEPMAAHCSWRAGGNAARYYEPADRADLAAFVRQSDPREPLLWVGLGSNLLVRDGGFQGTVIATQRALAATRFLGATTLYAEAGVACAKIARTAARRGSAGCEFFAGIPGTLGGALAMNAGAWGGETWGVIRAVETLDHAGVEHTRAPAEYRIGYRSVQAPGREWFLAAEIELGPAGAVDIGARIRDLLARRAATQPLGQPSCGSVFRNPPGDHAARLIEASGLKGQRCGGCQVSEKHANFIVNDGGATAADIERLIEHVRAVVRRDHGIDLVTEVQIVGVPA